jgi:branched-subunit amino acid ABC-type transport system permease component
MLAVAPTVAIAGLATGAGAPAGAARPEMGPQMRVNWLVVVVVTGTSRH